SRYRDLFEEGLIGGELLDTLEREQADVRRHREQPAALDLGLDSRKLIEAFDLFSGLTSAELDALARLFRPRLLVPGEMLMRTGERGRSMFFISSGAVEVRLANQRV